MILLLVAAAIVISSLLTAIVLGGVRRAVRWQRRRRTGPPGTLDLRRTPRFAGAGHPASRLRHCGWLVLQALGSAGPVAGPSVLDRAAADQLRWKDSQLLRATTEGDQFVLDCLVSAKGSGSEGRAPTGIPMAVWAHRPQGQSDDLEIGAAIRSWAATGTPVDISLGREGGVAVVRLAAPDRVLTLELDAPRAQ